MQIYENRRKSTNIYEYLRIYENLRQSTKINENSSTFSRKSRHFGDLFTQKSSFWWHYHAKLIILATFSRKSRHFDNFFKQKSSFGGPDSAARGRTQFHSRILMQKKGATHNENPPRSHRGAAREAPRITLLGPIAPGMLKNRLIEQEQPRDKGNDRI